MSLVSHRHSGGYISRGKNKEDLLAISLAHLEATGSVIITRVSEEQLDLLRSAKLPAEACLEYNSRARTVVIRSVVSVPKFGKVGILAAGTADIPVAEEAKVVAEEMGAQSSMSMMLVLLASIDSFHVLRRCRMSMHSLWRPAGRAPYHCCGRACRSSCYRSACIHRLRLGGGGLAALYSMLQSCSVLTVVNVDAGFVAGAFAAKIAIQKAYGKKQS